MLIWSIAYSVCGFCMNGVTNVPYNNVDKAAPEPLKNFCLTADYFDTQVTAEASGS